MLAIENLRGVIPPLVTPVDENENIDVNALRRVIDYVLAGGVHGVFVMGSNGEFYAFDYENQKLAVETAVKQVAGKVPVYAGANGITTKSCVKLVEMAENAGADAITILTPMFIKPNESEMYKHFVSVAESTNLPIILYNNPDKTTNDISVGLLEKLAKINNIIGIKNTSLNFAQTIEFINVSRKVGNFNVLAGSDYYIFGTLAYGGTGCVAGTANVAPRLVVEVYENYMSGNKEKALEAQLKLIPLRNTYNYGSFPVVMKDCLNLMGIPVGSPVRPISHCSKEKLFELAKVLSNLNLLEVKAENE